MAKCLSQIKRYFPKKPGFIAGLLFLLMGCIHPLFLTPRGYKTITADKYKLLLGAVGLCAALWLIWAIGEALKGNSPLKTSHRPSLSFRIADFAVLGFWIGAVISTLLSGDIRQSLFGDYQRNDGLATQTAYVLIYFILSRGLRPGRRHGVMMAVTAGVVWLYALLQACSLDPLHSFDFEGYLPAGGIPFTPYTMTFRTSLGNINIVSSWAVVITVVMGLLYLADGWKWRRVWLIGSFFGCHTLLMASSDSGIAGLGGTIFLLLPWLLATGERLIRLCRLCCVWSGTFVLYTLHFGAFGQGTVTAAQVLTGKGALSFGLFGIVTLTLTLWQRKDLRYPSPKTMRAIAAALMLALMLTAIAALLWLNTGASGTFYEIGQMLRGNFDDRFGSSRIFIWKRSLQAFSAKPLFGSGPDSFFRAFRPWQSEAYAVTGIYYDKAHNEYLQILVCQGIIGLGSYLAFLVACMGGGLQKIDQSPFFLPVLGGIAAYLIQGFFNISTPISTPILWILLSLCRNDSLALANLSK